MRLAILNVYVPFCSMITCKIVLVHYPGRISDLTTVCYAMAEPGLVISAPGVANIGSNHCVLRHGRTWPGDISQPLGLPNRIEPLVWPCLHAVVISSPGIANIGYNHCVTSWPGLVISALGVAKLCEWGGSKVSPSTSSWLWPALQGR